MPTEAAARQFAEVWLAAWNRHDLDTILAHYAPDVEFVSPYVANITGDPSGTIRGREALRAYFVRALGAYPDLHFELEGSLVGVRSVAVVYRSSSGQRAAELIVLNEHGQAVRVDVHYGPL